MKTFLQWLKGRNEDIDITGIYPPGYAGLGNYPDAYFSPTDPYIKASREAKTDSDEKPKKKKHKKKKKKKD